MINLILLIIIYTNNCLTLRVSTLSVLELKDFIIAISKLPPGSKVACLNIRELEDLDLWKCKAMR